MPGEPVVDDETVDAPGAEPIELTNKSVAKATSLLTELGRHRNGITVTELAQSVSLPRPTTFRLLLTLERAGFVDRQDGRYRLGWQIARLGRLADPYGGMVSRVQPVLDAYADRLDETLGFAIVRGDLEFDLIAEASGKRMLSVSHQYVGGTWPLHASATGKVVLAELDDARIRDVLPERLPTFTAGTITTRDALMGELRRVRDLGYSILDDELEEGLFAIGVPVRDDAGGLLGVLTINGPTQRLKSDRLPSTVDAGFRAAREVSATL